MGKLSPMPALWGILPRSPERHYPWILDMCAARAQDFITWAGPEFHTNSRVS